MKLLTLIALTAGLAAAQTYTGEHYTGNVCQPDSANGETNCAYVGSITGDIFASYAYITDTTGINFPPINPRQTPPTVNLTGVWTAMFQWDDGTGGSGSFVVANGSCTATGGPTDRYHAVYTVSCSGTDSNGNPVSKNHMYWTYLATSRAGGFWQPLQDHTGTTTFTAVGAVQN